MPVLNVLPCADLVKYLCTVRYQYGMYTVQYVLNDLPFADDLVSGTRQNGNVCTSFMYLMTMTPQLADDLVSGARQYGKVCTAFMYSMTPQLANDLVSGTRQNGNLFTECTRYLQCTQ